MGKRLLMGLLSVTLVMTSIPVTGIQAHASESGGLAEEESSAVADVQETESVFKDKEENCEFTEESSASIEETPEMPEITTDSETDSEETETESFWQMEKDSEEETTVIEIMEDILIEESEMELATAESLGVEEPILFAEKNVMYVGLGAESLGTVIANSDKYTNYASANATEIELRYVYASESLNKGGNLQLVDSAGNVIANTETGSSISWHKNYEEGGYYCSYESLYPTKKLTPGTYDIQYVVGYEITSVLSKVIITEDPFVKSAYVSSMNAGKMPFEISLTVENWTEELECLDVRLVDEEANELEAAYEIQDVYSYDSEECYIDFLVTPKTVLVKGEEYYLKISYEGQKTLYCATTIEAEKVGSRPVFQILEAKVADASRMIFEVKTEGLEAGSECQITVSERYSDTDITYYNDVQNAPEDGVFQVPLLKYGYPMPLSAYEGMELEIEISKIGSYVSESVYYDCPDSLYSSYYSTSISKKTGNTYHVKIVGQNIGLDIYQEGKNCDDWKVQIVNPSPSYKLVGEAAMKAGTYKISSETSARSVKYSFEFDVTLKSGQISEEYYYIIYHGTDWVTSAEIKTTSEPVELSYISSSQWDDDAMTFWHNFGMLPLYVSLKNTELPIKVRCKNITGTVVAESELTEYEYVYSSSTSYNVLLQLVEGKNFAADEEYSFEVIVDGTTLSYDDRYVYDDEVSGEPYIYLSTYDFYSDICDVTVDLSGGDIKNFSLASVESSAGYLDMSLVHVPTNKLISYTTTDVDYENEYRVTIQYDTPISFGEYKYRSRVTSDYYSNISVKDKRPIITDAGKDDDTGEIKIAGYNLTEGTYSADLYREGVGKCQSDIALTQANDSLLTFSGAISGNGYYLVVYKDGKMIGADSLYISSEYIIPDINISASYSEGNYSYNEFDYIAFSPDLQFEIFSPLYGRVRYAEDFNELTKQSYHVIGNEYDERITLSEGVGEKTVYFQFQNREGVESEIYLFHCLLTTYVEPKIISLNCDQNLELIVKDSEFTIEVLSNVRGYCTYVAFRGDDSYYNSKGYIEELHYTKETDEGYLYSRTFDSGDYYFDTYSFNEVAVFICEEDDTYYYEPISNVVTSAFSIIESLEHITIKEFSYGSLTTNEKQLVLNGIATSGNTLVLTLRGTSGQGSFQVTTTVEDNYKFSVTIPEIPDGTYRVTATDGVLSLEYTYTFILDTVTPVIKKVTAVKTQSDSDENVTISWELTDPQDVSYFLLWKNDVPVLTKSDYFSQTTTILPHYVDGDVYKVVAVDKAGNQSEPFIKILGDDEPPTAPTDLQIKSRASKSIELSWTAATDNVRVEGYEIYQDNEKVASVLSPTTTYLDKDLEIGKEYTYKVKAYDHALNKSEEVEINGTTIMPQLGEDLFVPEAEYVIETEDEIPFSANAQDDGNLVGMQLLFQYRLKDSIAWNTMHMEEVKSTRAYTHIENVKDWTEGEYEFRYLLKDRDGSEASSYYDVAIRHDYIAPIVSITAPIESDTEIYNKEVLIRGSVEDETRMGKVTVYVSDNGEIYDKLYTVDTTEEQEGSYSWETKINYSCNWDTTDIYSEKGYIKIVGEDYRGNQTIMIREINLDNQAPMAPVNCEIISDQQKITISWLKEPIEDDFDTFKIYRSDAQEGPFTLISTQKFYNYYDDTTKGITDKKEYYYYVTALDKLGNESDANVILKGMLQEDVTKPVVNSVVPRNNYKICRRAEIKAAAYDNYRLAALSMEYREKGQEEWTSLAEFTSDRKKDVFVYDWDISEMSGDYEIRFIATDSNQLVSDEVIYNYKIEAYSEPEMPELTLKPIHKGMDLSWSYSGNKDIVSKYVIYRKQADGEFTRVASTGSENYRDKKLSVDETYTYKVQVVDRYGGTQYSEEKTATVIRDDHENPQVVYIPNNYMTTVSQDIIFDASGSTDNDEIVSYRWDLGDGTTADGKKVTHQFSELGDYEVSLTITDDSGNKSDKKSVIRVVEAGTESPNGEIYQLVTVCSVSSKDGSAIGNAELTIRKEGASEEEYITVITEESGTKQMILETGSYTATVVKDGYSASSARFSVVDKENQEITVVLRSMDILQGDLTATEMTYDEIVAAGIDINDPDNQHVFKFATVFHFTTEKGQTYTIPYSFYKNDAGYILGYDYSYVPKLSGGGIGYTKIGNMKIAIHPVSEELYLVIYGEAHWLKEMFNVELLLTNSSSVEWFEDCQATLQLPEGLSLAKMLSSKQQTATIDIGTIESRGTEKVNWYVRGDAEGEYNLTAMVSGCYMPNDEPFTKSFTTKTPLKVWTGSAMQIVVSAEDVARVGQPYEVEFDIRNVSTKPIYDLTFQITGSEQYVVKEGNTYLVKEDDGSVKLEVDELGIGENKTYLYETTISNSALLEHLEYYLKDCFAVTMEGSTTEIPIVFNIVHTSGALGVEEESKGAIAFKVLRESDLSPVEGVYVFSDYIEYGKAKRTDELGRVTFENVNYTPDQQMVGVSFEEESIPIRTMRYFLSSEYQEYTIYIPDTTDPYVSSLTFMNQDGKKRSYTYMTVAKYAVESGSKDKHTIDVDVNWQDKIPGKVYLLGEISEEMLELEEYGEKDGIVSYIVEDAVGKRFAEGEEIWIVLTSQDNKYTSAFPLKVIKNRVADVVKTTLEQFRLPDVLETTATDLAYASGQLLGGESLKFGLDFSDGLEDYINVADVEVDADKIKFSIGQKQSDSKKFSEALLEARMIGGVKTKTKSSIEFAINYDEFGYTGYEGYIKTSLANGPEWKNYIGDKNNVEGYKELYRNRYYIPGGYGTYVVTSITGGFDTKIGFSNKRLEGVAFKGAVSPKIAGSVGIGAGIESINAEPVKGEIEGKLNINYGTDVKYPIDAVVNASVKGSVTVLNGNIEWTYPSLETEWKYPDPDKEYKEEIKQKLADAENNADWYSRDTSKSVGLQRNLETNGEGVQSEDIILMQDTYKGIVAKVIPTHQDSVMILNMPQRDRTSANKNALMYSVKTLTDWREPQVINQGSDTLDGEFAGCATADGAVLLYQEMNKTFAKGYGEEELDVDDYYSYFDIACIQYNSETDSWGESVHLSNDSKYQFAPSISAYENQMAAVWLTAKTETYFEDGLCDIQYSMFDGNDWSQVYTIPCNRELHSLSSSLGADGLSIGYTEVQDGLPVQKHISVKDSVNISDALSIGNENESAFDGIEFFHNGKSNTAYIGDYEVVVCSQDGVNSIAADISASKLQLAQNGDEAVLYWLEVSETEDGLRQYVCMSRYDSLRNEWSPKICPIESEGNIGNISGTIIDKDHMEFVYTETLGETTNLRYRTVSTAITDIVLNTEAVSGRWKANGTYSISIPYYNNGTQTVEGVTVTVYENDANGEVLATKNITEPIYPGKENLLSISFATDTIIDNVYIVFSDGNQIYVQENLQLTSSEIVINDAYFEATPGTYNCNISVGNVGTCTSEKLIVEIREDDINGEVIARQDIVDLNAQELRWLHIEIPKDSVWFSDDVKSFYVNIYSADVSETDICEIVYLYKPSDVEYSESLSEARKALHETIGTANDELERKDKDVFVSLKGKEVLVDNYWITASVYNTFVDAIKVAEAQMYQTSMSESDINQANTLLKKAIQNYKKAYKKGLLVKATKITISQENIDLLVGKTATLKVTSLPKKNTDVVISWESADTEVASVTSKGVVKAIGCGSTTIKAKLLSGQEVVCDVNVYAGTDSIILDQNKIILSLGLGEEKARGLVKATIGGEQTDAVKYTSSKPKVASVDSKTGEIQALTAGTTTITASTLSGKKAVCQVSVVQYATGLALDKQSADILINKSVTLKATVTPKKMSDKILWSSSNPEVATVTEKGVVKGVSAGTTTIQAKSSVSGITVSCEVSVHKPATGIVLQDSNIELVINGDIQNSEKQLIYTVDEDNYVTFSSSNKKVAIIDSNGLICAVGKGTTTITAKTLNGKKATCKVNVTVYAESVSVSGGSSNVLIGKSMKLKYSMLPKANNDKVTWSSSNENIATVTDKGVVRGVAAGTVVIKATTIYGVSDTFRVNIINGASGISLDKKTMSLAINNADISSTGKLIATYKGENTNDRVTYSSSNKKVAVVTSTGKVVAKGKGNATITAKTVSGKKATCTVSVTTYAKAISITTSNPTIGLGKKFTLKAVAYAGSVKKNLISNKNVIWKLAREEDANYVSLTEQGSITALKQKSGTIAVRAYPKDGTKIYKTIYVTIVPEVNRIEVTPKEVNWKIGEKYNLWDVFDFTALDMNGDEIITGIEVVLSSKSKKYLSLHKNGDIFALKDGKTEITVQITDSLGKKQKTEIVVYISK